MLHVDGGIFKSGMPNGLQINIQLICGRKAMLLRIVCMFQLRKCILENNWIYMTFHCYLIQLPLEKCLYPGKRNIDKNGCLQVQH